MMSKLLRVEYGKGPVSRQLVFTKSPSAAHAESIPLGFIWFRALRPDKGGNPRGGGEV